MIRCCMFSPLIGSDANSYCQVLHLLSVCEKYEMDSIQSLIRTKVRSKEFPAPTGTEAFAAYAIASGKGLIPEMEKAARLTLDHPMTFETLGEGLRLFEGCALRNLANFRRRCYVNVVECLDSYLEVGPSAPSWIWIGCPKSIPSVSLSGALQQLESHALPTWLNEFLSQGRGDLELHKFTQPPGIVLKGRWRRYYDALRTHGDCDSCMSVQGIDALEYILELDEQITRVLEKVTHSFDDLTSTTSFPLVQVCRDRGSFLGLTHPNTRNR